MHKFDPYEYIGVIIPGVVVVLTLILLYPGASAVLSSGVTVGEFGLILILAIVAGHLIQALGNAYEGFVWGVLGGMPTTWPAKKSRGLLSAKQLERLETAIRADFDAPLSELASGRGPVREINAAVRAKGKTDRIEAFNRNYGLLRGISAALIVAGVLVVVVDRNDWVISLMLVAAAAVATYRMTRFGQHYAREMFVEYLRCRDQSPDPEPGDK
jgi:hypothetical protein